MSHKVLSYDLGGTKVAVGIINRRGKLLEEVREPIRLAEGKETVIRQLVQLGKFFLKKYPDILAVGVGSAGPLDPVKGLLLDPTNFVGPKGSWGIVPITSLLKKSFGRPVYLENDAASAVLAEKWIGEGKKFQNIMTLTLGTGLGTGIICNGKLLRTGKHLHPEAGHIIINANDSSAPCGCGNLGCAEAYLSGRSFARRSRQRFANANLSAQEISEMARNRDPRALAAFDEYAQIMAVTIQNYCRIFYPEIIILAGSFSASSDLFLASTKRHLNRLLGQNRKGWNLVPKLTVSKLKNSSGLVGGAYVAFQKINSSS